MSLHTLTISLTHASGPIGRVAGHNLSLFLSAARLPDLRTTGSVSLRGRPTADFSLTPEQFEELRRAAEAAGLPDRAPAVEEVIDTSDRWAWVLLYVAHERGERTIRLSLLSSGFVGADAPALHRFFDVLLRIAGADDASIRHDLAGG